jgi:hypothetical protein
LPPARTPEEERKGAGKGGARRRLRGGSKGKKVQCSTYIAIIKEH